MKPMGLEMQKMFKNMFKNNADLKAFKRDSAGNFYCPVCDTIMTKNVLDTNVVIPTFRNGHEACEKIYDRNKYPEKYEKENYEKEQKISELLSNAYRYTHLIPGSCTFDNFKIEKYNQKAFEIVSTWKAGNPGILLTGTPGTGKTHLMRALIYKACTKWQKGCLFVQTRAWLDMILSRSNIEADDDLKLASTIGILVLDDIGVQTLTEAADERLQRILETRLERRLPTFATSNLPTTSLSKYLSPRTLSRFCSLMEVEQLNGPDFRKELLI